MRIGNNKYNSVATLQENNILFSINQNGTNAYEISIHYVDEKGYSRNLLHRISGTFRTLFNKIRATDYCHLYLIEDKAYILVLINDFYIKTAEMLGQSISKVPYDSVGNTFKLIELENKPSFYYYVASCDIENIDNNYEITANGKSIKLNKWYNTIPIRIMAIISLVGYIIAFIIGLKRLNKVYYLSQQSTWKVLR